MIQTRIVIRPTRSVRDIYRGRKYRIVARFPGGREIDLGHAETRPRAFEKALQAGRVQTSPTAGGGGTFYEPGNPEETTTPWKRNLNKPDIIFE